MKEKATALKSANVLLGLTETKDSKKKRICLQSPSESSQKETLTLGDDSDEDLDRPFDAEGEEKNVTCPILKI